MSESECLSGDPKTTIADIVRFLIDAPSWPKGYDRASLIAWPPDVFAVAMSLLRHSAGYLEAARQWPPSEIRLSESQVIHFNDASATGDKSGLKERSAIEKWHAVVGDEAASWLEAIKQSSKIRDVKVPVLLDAAWTLVESAQGIVARHLVAENPAIVYALMFLVAVADEASVSVGITQEKEASPTRANEYRTRVMDQLDKYRSVNQSIRDDPKRNRNTPLVASTLCRQVNARKLLVLPKMRTPQAGVTIRSLTHHLALIPGGEVAPTWNKFDSDSTLHFENSLTLLLIPEPEEVHPSYFNAVSDRGNPNCRRLANTNRRFFQYRPDEDWDGRKLEGFMKKAKKQIGNIDGVVFPEMALTAKQFEQTKMRLLGMEDREVGAKFLVAGVIEMGRTEADYDTNKAVFRCRVSKRMEDLQREFPELPQQKGTYGTEQHKHHRWHLDRRQICQYGLGSKLPPSAQWIEYIHMPPRHIDFILINETILIAVLICEDLAQSDPIGDVIRAVGPNLVICLLADGPQLTSRWSSRYATGLADDPGCAVLTLTSRGMSALSRTESGKNHNDVIALWKDPERGSREISIDSNAGAIALSISLEKEEQFTMDGRPDGKRTLTPTLTGVHMIRKEDK